MVRKKPGPDSRYSKTLGLFIADKVADGMTLKKIHEDYISEVPTPKCIIEWQKKYPEFKEAIHSAYGIQIYKQLDELNELSGELLKIDEELRDKISSARKSGDEQEMKEALAYAKIYSSMLRDRRDNIRVRIDAIKFSLSKLAHIFVKEFREPAKTQIALAPTVQIINYKDTLETVAIKLIEGT